MPLPSLLLGALLALDPLPAPPVERPNILLLLADDQGWNGTSVPMDPAWELSGAADMHTPALERLAQEGRRYTRAYASAPVCSPSRAALQTGITPGTLGWTTSERGRGRARPSLAGELLSLGEVLQQSGYATAHFGKWHIEGGGPGAHGYEVHDGNLGNEEAARHPAPNPCDIFGMAERASQFMRDSVEQERPFFAQLSWLALHAPDNARPETLESVRERWSGNARRLSRVALAEDLDAGVGRLLDVLDELGVAEDTLVIYTSDNGGAVPGERALRGGKSTLWEGGLRVPFLVRGPGVRPGSTDATPIALHDLYPTFAALAGASESVPATVQGGSLVADFAGSAERIQRGREGLYFHASSDGGGGPSAALIDERWKLVLFEDAQACALHDLLTDPGESRDLAGEEVERSAQLRARLEAYLAQNGSVAGSAEGSPRRRRRER